eukprot:CAMPEP_0118667434 /NCGR_PEP_ID=MMETSP0785-20121206/19790_1 /TAXON_ID=91992 /ORGANISM="Bolidomonas pacifica, Strain CCMP 1866" /LENGTH=195 /DNA_ID=CAMNT_0006561899 /DNA_START=513 /DNA_END=1096 /DNA_ORIENTATION=-
MSTIPTSTKAEVHLSQIITFTRTPSIEKPQELFASSSIISPSHLMVSLTPSIGRVTVADLYDTGLPPKLPRYLLNPIFVAFSPNASHSAALHLKGAPEILTLNSSSTLPSLSMRLLCLPLTIGVSKTSSILLFVLTITPGVNLMSSSCASTSWYSNIKRSLSSLHIFKARSFTLSDGIPDIKSKKELKTSPHASP